MIITLVGILAATGTVVLIAWVYLSIGDRDGWAITIYSGDDPLRLKPHPSVDRHPAIRAGDVIDARARFVADPFMVHEGGRWFMFLEIFNENSRRGEIALATSPDALRWHYERVVLREPFHLSYPQVFQWNGCYYMLPETRAASAVRLYRAVRFPGQWEFVGELLTGPYADSTVVQHNGLWWLFAYSRDDSLSLYCAPEPVGPWEVHPASPIVTASKTISRPAGRIVQYQGRLLRYAQDGTCTYGGALRVVQIDHLTRVEYAEHEVPESPILGATGTGWNADGMHHVDVHPLGEGHWIACVDGNQIRTVVNWRKGASRLRDILLRSRVP